MTNEILENKNKGFSLVELIVVIAIMAVMTSVLAPSLLGYVEKSRMQKDDSAMGEVMNAVKLALADQDVYDECLTYNVRGNYSCYIDDTHKDTTASDTTAFLFKPAKTANNNYTTGENGGSWRFNDDVRTDDEQFYNAAGNMRGMTITFYPTKSGNTSVYKLESAYINDMGKYGSATGATNRAAAKSKLKDGTTAATLKTITSGAAGKTGVLYNKLRAAVGDSITLSSQTYRNSEYTVFIRMGSTGGNNSDAQDAVDVYGEWNGTNLAEPIRPVTGTPGTGEGG